jgi:hypothetical protein
MRCARQRRHAVVDLSQISEHMEIIGADGVHVGTVDRVEGNRIKMMKADSGSHGDHHHYLSAGLVAEIEGNQVRLSATGASALLFEEEDDGGALADKNPD